jgi:ribosomal protein S18 acetylase RimI-like enzyme
MGVTYFKRYRMETPLGRISLASLSFPLGYGLVRWDRSLLEQHAEAKFRSFCSEIDSHVFPCLGDPTGCRRLMREISEKRGFLPQATWLISHQARLSGQVDYCGTIQGISDDTGCGSIQNLGIAPEHRGQGLGTRLLLAALAGFAHAGLRRASLEVTAQNTSAVRLYRRVGFRRVKTVYKAVEVAYS